MMHRDLRKLFRFIGLFIGDFHWSPPIWLRVFFTRIFAPSGMGLARILRILRSPRNATIFMFFLVAVAGAIAAYQLWPEPEKEVEPIKLSVTVKPPMRKTIGKDHKPNPLIVRFDGSAARIEEVDKKTGAGLTLSPKIEGTWQWKGDRELNFNPEKDWPILREFTLTIDESFLPEHVVIEEYEYEFTTSKFIAKAKRASFYVDEIKPDLKTVFATISFSHPVSPKSLEERISLSYGDPTKPKSFRDFGFKVQYNDLYSEAYIHSDNIPIPMRDSTMEIDVKEGVKAAVGGPGSEKHLKKIVNVPGMYSYFRVESSGLSFARNKNDEPEQVLFFETRVKVHEKEIKNKIKVWVLPKDKPAMEGRKAEKNYQWYDEKEINPRILRLGERLELEHVPGEMEYSKRHVFKLKAEVGRQIYVKLAKGTKAWGGYVLAYTYDEIHSVPEYPKDLKIMHDGAILATSGEKKLSILARGIDGVQVELSRVLPTELNHLISQTGGEFKNPHFRNYGFDEENLSEIFSEKRKLENNDPSKTLYTAVDFSKYLRTDWGVSRGLFLLKVQSWDPEEDSLTGRSDKRLILVTDMGILAKQDANFNNHIFVQSIRTGAPKVGALVEVLGKNGLPVLKARTGADGLVEFPSLDSFSKQKKPVAYVVKAGDDFSFLPLNRSDRHIDYSRFDIGGNVTAGKADKLDAYLFSDRGIYRPGDTFHVGLIAKATDWTKPIDGIPVQVVVTDPRGVNVFTDRTTLLESGFIETSWATEESSPTGVYTVRAHIVRDDKPDDFLGSTTVRVEEFLPDRMRIKTEFLDAPLVGWISPETVTAKVSLHNLYGTAAANRRVSGRIALSARYPAFKGYGDYKFYDPMRAKESHTQGLYDEQTDDNGEAVFDIDLSDYDGATYSLTFMAEGFEADGGRSVSSQAKVVVSPLKHIIGYKTDGGGLRYISRDSERTLKFIAINSKLKKTAVPNLRAILYEKRYISTLVRQYNGTYKYQSVERRVKADKKRIRIPAKGFDYRLPTGTPGEFILVIEDKDENQLASIPYSVAGAANLDKSLERSADLEIRLDKKDYAPGEEIQVSIKAPYEGAGLITIERDRIFAHKWFQADSKSSVQTITVPDGIDVNAYVNVAFVRRLDSSEIFMSPLCFAVKPFSIKRTKKVHDITLTVPETVKPGDEMRIGYSTVEPAKIVVFAVDEGILQVAEYKTPDPLSHFLSKRALEVTTSQILDMILPEYQVFKNTSNFGGDDDEGAEALGHNLNPFKRKREKPVVFWSGIIDADEETRELTYEVPDYFNGTLRVMAVAVSQSRLGAAETKSIVKGPFVIHPSAPMFAAPGDIFDMGVAVGNNVEGSGAKAKVKLELEVTENLEIIGDKKHTIEIAEGREGTARFKIKAKARLGNANLTFKAKLKGKETTYKSTLSVRPKNPYLTTLQAGMVRDDVAEIPIGRKIYPEYRELNISVSPVPLALADGLAAYLRKFPHGCTEQLVSQTVPSLVLRDHLDFGYDKKTSLEAISHTIRILRARQNSEGAFGYWAANSHVSDQQVVYAMQFLTEAKERGYHVPAGVIERGNGYLEDLVKRDIDSHSDARLRSYAIYILARNGVLSSDELAGLREYLAAHKEFEWKRDITFGYLAATYVLMQDKRESIKLIKKMDLTKDTKADYNDFYDNQVYRGTMLYLLAKHFPAELKELDSSVIKRIADDIAGGSYNTLSSARIIYGLEAYATQVKSSIGPEGLDAIEVFEVISKDKKQKLKLKGSLITRADFAGNTQSLQIKAKGDYPVFYQVTMSGFDFDKGKDVLLKQGVEIIRELRTLDKKPVEAVSLGDEIEVVLKMRSIQDYRVSNLAIVDLLPSGFEVVLVRGENVSNSGRIGTPKSTWSPVYSDIREDRIALYGSIGRDIKLFIYRIKATSRGEFAIPPTYMESMYDRTTKARTASSKIRVVDPK
ncbi:MAG: alpha-2-macroglobulin [Deltaproteobacteria bacterium]|nr:alpha-2-macroglobulin [Deltaproteobacteria bacterium]